jgi:hypothetical protein
MWFSGQAKFRVAPKPEFFNNIGDNTSLLRTLSPDWISRLVHPLDGVSARQSRRCVRYLGVEVEDALAIAESIDV